MYLLFKVLSVKLATEKTTVHQRKENISVLVELQWKLHRETEIRWDDV